MTCLIIHVTIKHVIDSLVIIILSSQCDIEIEGILNFLLFRFLSRNTSRISVDECVEFYRHISVAKIEKIA